MGHGAQQERTPTASLDAASAATVATTLQALATQSRLLMLTRLRQGACTVGELAEAVEMEQSAVSFYSKTQDEPIFLVNQILAIWFFFLSPQYFLLPVLQNYLE